MCLSHVSHTVNALLPVKDLSQFARQRNVVTVVDGAQACGMIELNLP